MNRTARGHNHMEAFCHMQYECRSGHLFTVWNSRDGVTPFFLDCMIDGCKVESKHINWGQDRYDPGYQLKPGDFLFCDMTPQRAEASAKRTVETFKDDVEFRRVFGSPEQAIKRLTKSYLGEGDSPAVEIFRP